MDVDVHTCVVVHFSHFGALGELLLTLRVGDLAAFDACVKLGRPAHELGLAEAVIEQRLESLLGCLRHVAVAVGDAANAHAVEDGVGLVGGRSATRKGEAGGGGDCGAKKSTAGKRVGCHGENEERLSGLIDTFFLPHSPREVTPNCCTLE